MDLQKAFVLGSLINILSFYFILGICFLIFKFLVRFNNAKALLFTLIVGPLLYFGSQLLLQLSQLN